MADRQVVVSPDADAPPRLARRGPGRPTRAVRETLRDHVLDCAWAEFGRLGFGATTVQGICATAGIGLATFYRLFPDKGAVFAEVMQRVGRKISACTLQIDPALSFEQGLIRFGRMFAGFVMEDRFSTATWLLFSEGRKFPQIARSFHEMSRPWLDVLAGVIARHRRDLSDEEAVEYAQLFCEMVAGRINRDRIVGQAGIEPAVIDRTIRRAAAVFVHGIVAADPHADAVDNGQGG